jgi:hypothetical protein
MTELEIMLSTLHQFLNEKREVALRERSTESSRYDIIGKLYFLLIG